MRYLDTSLCEVVGPTQKRQALQSLAFQVQWNVYPSARPERVSGKATDLERVSRPGLNGAPKSTGANSIINSPVRIELT